MRRRQIPQGRALGGVVLAGAADKPHGVREACLLDPEGYCRVPTVPRPG